MEEGRSFDRKGGNRVVVGRMGLIRREEDCMIEEGKKEEQWVELDRGLGGKRDRKKGNRRKERRNWE